MNNVSISYYRDGYHYSKFTYQDEVKYVQCTADVKINLDCAGKTGEFIDNGYNALFCKDDSTPIPFNCITESTELYIKGKEGSDSPFENKDKYYALIRNNSESLLMLVLLVMRVLVVIWLIFLVTIVLMKLIILLV